MSYKKHVQIVPTGQRLKASMANHSHVTHSGATSGNFSSDLPQFYSGSPMRLERYDQYDGMDADSEVNAALDIIANFSTRLDPKTKLPFEIIYNKEASETEVEILKTCLLQWTKVNDFKKRLWGMMRSTIKYGDQFFIRDPETLKWHWVDPRKVDKILVNEADGKQPEAYVFRDLDLNLASFTVTGPEAQGQNGVGGVSQMPISRPSRDSNRWGSSPSGRFSSEASLTAVEATHVVHLSLSQGMDTNWPFGGSVLESVYKVFREKSLLEEAIIIYRIQRAPERRIFYVDVGGMPLHKVSGHLERVKNEIHQRRYPNRTGGGANIGDSTYNPMSTMEDLFFAQGSDGRGSRVETLPGGENLGQIDDLKYWTNKLLRGLRIPSSYLPTSPEDGSQSFSDGRVGTAYIQENHFAEYCERLQNLVGQPFDDEFKLFVRQRGYNIDSSMYDLAFNTPDNFLSYLKMERDSAAISVYQPLAEQPHFSRRWLMKNKLNMTDDEILENEKMWREENRDKTSGTAAEDGFVGGGEAGLDSIGIRPMDDMDDMGDVDGELSGDEAELANASPISGDENSGEEDYEL